MGLLDLADGIDRYDFIDVTAVEKGIYGIGDLGVGWRGFWECWKGYTCMLKASVIGRRAGVCLSRFKLLMNACKLVRIFP